MKPRYVQLFNSILLSIYFVGSIPFFISQGSSLEGHPIVGAFYFYYIIFYEIFVLSALLFQWVGYLTKSRGWIRFANWVLLIGSFIGVLLIVPIFVTIPIIFINMISKSPKKVTKAES